MAYNKAKVPSQYVSAANTEGSGSQLQIGKLSDLRSMFRNATAADTDRRLVSAMHCPCLMRMAVSMGLCASGCEPPDVSGQQGPYRDGDSGKGQVGSNVPDGMHGCRRKDLLELRLGQRLQQRQQRLQLRQPSSMCRPATPTTTARHDSTYAGAA